MMYKNNPFALRQNHFNWIGECGDPDSGQCEFSSVSYAVTALIKIIMDYAPEHGIHFLSAALKYYNFFWNNRNLAISRFDHLWQNTPIDPTTRIERLTENDLWHIISYMAMINTEYKLAYEDFKLGYEIYAELKKNAN